VTYAELRSDRSRLYLGLVHHKNGVEGTQRRIDTARRHYQRGFGVATECGMGRKPRERVPELLEIQAQVRVRLPEGMPRRSGGKAFIDA
jgi:hypothetical protein